MDQKEPIWTDEILSDHNTESIYNATDLFESRISHLKCAEYTARHESKIYHYKNELPHIE